MTASPLVLAIANRLEEVGYIPVRTPFKVASVSFDFTRALRGSSGRSLDLVIVVDTTTGDFGDKEPAHVRRRIEALSRALDVTGSRLVLTVVLAGAMLNAEVDALAAVCRVLVVEPMAVEIDGMPKDGMTQRLLDDRIRLLLPLEIPSRNIADGPDPTPMEKLLQVVPGDVDKVLAEAVFEASHEGDEAVTAAMSAVINQALITEEKPT
jgi:hypothetical protein